MENIETRIHLTFIQVFISKRYKKIFSFDELFVDKSINLWAKKSGKEKFIIISIYLYVQHFVDFLHKFETFMVKSRMIPY